MKYEIEVDQLFNIFIIYWYNENKFILNKNLILWSFDLLENMSLSEMVKRIVIIPEQSCQRVHIFNYPNFRLLVDNDEVAFLNAFGFFNMDDYISAKTPYKILNIDEVEKSAIKLKIANKEAIFVFEEMDTNSKQVKVKLLDMSDYIDSLENKINFKY